MFLEPRAGFEACVGLMCLFGQKAILPFPAGTSTINSKSIREKEDWNLAVWSFSRPYSLEALCHTSGTFSLCWAQGIHYKCSFTTSSYALTVLDTGQVRSPTLIVGHEPKLYSSVATQKPL